MNVNIKDLLKKRRTDPIGDIFGAQHMDAMADAVKPTRWHAKAAMEASKNDKPIDVADIKFDAEFYKQLAEWAERIKKRKGKNKGGYVMTGAETMLGLD